MSEKTIQIDENQGNQQIPLFNNKILKEVQKSKSPNDPLVGKNFIPVNKAEFNSIKGAFQVIRGLNKLIINENNQKNLVKRICDHLIITKGYMNVQIMLIDEDEDLIDFIEAGIIRDTPLITDNTKSNKFFKDIKKALNEHGVGFINISSNKSEQCSQETDTLFAAKLEYRQKWFGILLITTPSTYEFSEDEIILLCDIANDIGYALYNLELNKERDKAEKRVWRDIEQQKLLLQEIHHRVRNNLQIIRSLISIQLNSNHNKAAIQTLKVCLSQVSSISMIHDQIYNAYDFASIDFRSYVSQLIKQLSRDNNAFSKNIKITQDIKNISLCLEDAIPCGLLINELVSNALKHAFLPDSNKNKFIKISMFADKDNVIHLSISDNGKGFENCIELEKATTCGLKISYILATKQLLGEIKLYNRNGTRFHIRFNKTDGIDVK